jgi:voltage-gated potassium channel
LPTAIGATKVAQLIVRPSAESMLEQLVHRREMNEELGHIGLQFNELQVAAGSPQAEKALSDVEVRSNHGFLIVGIRFADGSTVLNPDASTNLSVGDTVIVLGHNDDIPQLAAKFSSGTGRMMYRGVAVET